MTTTPSGPSGPSIWGTFNPVSKEFKEAEQVFHELTWWQQAIVVSASVIGGLFFIVGAFPAFCWTTHWIRRPGQNEQADKVEQAIGSFFQKISSQDAAPEQSDHSPKILEEKSQNIVQNSQNAPQHIRTKQNVQPPKVLEKPKSTFDIPKNSIPSMTDRPLSDTAAAITDSSFPSISFSREITQNHTLPWIFTQKYVDDKSKRFDALAAFLKSLTFDPPIDFTKITICELLMGALLVARGDFNRSDKKSAPYEDPTIQIKIFELLDPLMIKLYKDTSLSIPLRQEIKSTYLYMVGCLIEHSTRVLKKIPKGDDFESLRDIEKDPNAVSVSSLLFPFSQWAKRQSIPKGLVLKMHRGADHFTHWQLTWALKGLKLEEKKYSTEIFQDVFLEMEKTTQKTIVPELSYSHFKKGEYFVENVYRMAQSLLKLYEQDKEAFKNKFKTCFPGEDFDFYLKQLKESHTLPFSTKNPLLFEIPLFAEAFHVKVDCYAADSQGNLEIIHIGPKEAATTLTIGVRSNHPTSGYPLNL